MSTQIVTNIPKLRAAEVEKKADQIQSESGLKKRDQDLKDIRLHRKLASYAKVELLNQPVPPGQAKNPVREFDPAVLEVISKALAKKHGVPDETASHAVMQAYAGLQESWLKQDMTRQQAAAGDLKKIATANPSPRVPTYASLESDADHTLAKDKRRSPDSAPKI